MKSTPRKSKTAPAKGTQSTKPKTKGSKAVATAPATSHPSTAKTPPNPASGTPSAKPSDAEVIQFLEGKTLEEIKAMMGETSDQIPESPPPASGTARAGMTVNEFSDVVTNEADMRAGGWSEEEIKEIKAGKERAKAEAELEASAL